jgi:hypothetical protein
VKQDEMIEMARQAQMPFYWRTGEITYLDKLEAFANLVVQHAKAEEREACAEIAEWCIQNHLEHHIPERIRARGKHDTR